MDFEDNLNSLYCDPNAYIQRFEKEEKAKKIVFQEPYECLPNFYINNDFKKHDCDCVKRNAKDCNCNHEKCFNNKQLDNLFLKDVYNHNNRDYNCNHGNHNSNNKCNHDKNTNEKCHNDKNSKQNGFGFDMKSLLPLLSMFNKSGGADLSQLVGLLNSGVNSQNQNGLQSENKSNPISLISSILSNPNAISGILNLFKGSGLNLFNKKQPAKKQLKTTDFEIKNYTRVE